MPRRRLPQIVFTLTRRYTIAFLTFVSFLAACSHGVAKPQHGNETTRIRDLFWLNGDALLVRQYYPDKDWIYFTSTRQQLPLPGIESYRHIAISPNGLVLSVVNESSGKLIVFYTRDLRNKPPHGINIHIPTVQNLSKNLKLHWNTKAFWITNDQLYVESYNDDPDRDKNDGLCQVFTLTTQRWQSLQHCFGLHTHPGRVTYVKLLGSDSYAAYSSAEGVVAVRIVRWNSRSREVNSGPNDIEIGFGPYAGGEIYFDNTMKQLYVLSVYTFKSDGAINPIDADVVENLPLKLYRWSPRDTKTRFAPTNFQIPRYASLYSVTNKKVAWVDSVNKQICIRNPNQDAVCHSFKFD